MSELSPIFPSSFPDAFLAAPLVAPAGSSHNRLLFTFGLIEALLALHVIFSQLTPVSREGIRAARCPDATQQTGIHDPHGGDFSQALA
jgi:hypothetical protein